jgi:hypothetical protein
MMHVNPLDAKVIELHKDLPDPPKKRQRVWVNQKLLGVAIGIELIIVGAVLFANWQFAERYSDGNSMQWWMAIICGISMPPLNWRVCRWLSLRQPIDAGSFGRSRSSFSCSP